ncbi:MAG: hypothetical protein ACQEQF_05895 [Bacillota bacterium]
MSKENSKDDKKKKDALNMGLGGAAVNNVDKYGSAAKEFIKGYKGKIGPDGEIINKGLKHISQSKVHPDYEYQNLKQQAGFSAEVNYENKANAENIINENQEKISRTDNVGMNNHPKFDHIAIDENGNPILNSNGKPIWGAQMKFCGKYGTPGEIRNSAEKLANKLAKTNSEWDKYRGNTINVPSEQYEIIQEYSKNRSKELFKQAQNFKEQGNIKKAELLEKKANNFNQVVKDVEDSGITSEEAMFLREHPKLATAKYIAENAHEAGKQQAKVGAIITATVSFSQNIVAVIRDDKEIDEASLDVLKDVTKGSIISYGIGSGGTVIKSLMQTSRKNVVKNLSKTNLPAMIATTTLQMIKSLKRYANNEIDELELVQEMGEKGTGMLSASMGAAVGGSVGTLILPGIGTVTGSVIGSMVGYMSSSQLYQSTLQLLEEEKLSNQKRDLINQLSNRALKEMKRKQKELEDVIVNKIGEDRKKFNKAFKKINDAAIKKNINEFSEGLNQIALVFGRKLKFKNFDDFNEFMKDDDTVFSF